jgi:hypothetical protein
MKRICIAVAAFLSLIGIAAWAQELETTSAPDSTDAAEGAPSGVVELDFSGDHEFRYRLPAYHRSYDGTAREPELSSLLRVQADSGEVKLVSEVEAVLRAGDSGERAALDFDAGENAIYWDARSLRLGIGWQYFSWGVADGQNPTDNLNARDYSLGLESKKLPALALSVSWYPADAVSIQLVAKPKAEACVFPSDFAAAAQAGADSYDAALNGALSASVASTSVEEEPVANEPASAAVGARVAFTTAAADFSASYLYDWDRYYTPDIALASVAGYRYPASIELERRRLHVFGADAKATVGAFGLWLESAFTLPEGYAKGDYAVRGPALDWTLGGDISFGPSSSFYANLQYIGRYLPAYDRSFYEDYEGGSPDRSRLKDVDYMQEYFERALTQKLGGQTEGLLQGCAVKLKLPLPSTSITPSVKAVYLMPFLYDETEVRRYGSLALMPEIEIEPADSFHIRIGAELGYAWIRPRGGDVELDTTSDRIGVHTPDNNFFLSVEYAWAVRKTKTGR